MEAWFPLVLIAVIGATIATVAGILLRQPLILLDMKTRLTAAEREIAELDAKVKKALRRIGIEERKARTAETPPAPTPHPELPFGESEEDPLDAAARLARLNGHVRSRVRAGR